MLSILFQTLGCKLNQLESESLAGSFTEAGFELFSPGTSRKPAPEGTCFPSIIVINTCTVTSKADQKTRRFIRKALRDYPSSFVLVTGCYAQLNFDRIKLLDPESADRLFVLKGREKDTLAKLPALVDENNKNLPAAIKSLCEGGNITADKNPESFSFSPASFSGRTRSFLKIQDGCDKHCTYCVIRSARGPNISLSAEQALRRLQTLEKSHVEAVITGINICQYNDSTGGLKELLAFLIDGTEKISLRLSSLSPECIDEDFVNVLANNRIRPSFHLSVQSLSNSILEKMGRCYTAETVINAVALLRSVKDNPFLACDIITGFPGETETEFNKTFELCRKIGFAWIHVFPYSKREGTPAASFKGSLPDKEITKRVQLLTDLAWQGRADYIRRWLGREVEVLIEKSSDTKVCRGVSENYLKLLVQYEGETPQPGSVFRCLLPFDQIIDIPKNDFDAAAIARNW